MAQPLVFDFYNSIIEVPYPDTSLDLQYLVNEVRDTEDELCPPMGYPKIMDAYGKQALGGGTYVGITVVLLDNWKLKFQDRENPPTISCIVTGGNLVAESGNPIAPSDYTTVTIAQSSSPTIATPADDVNLRYLIASLSETKKQVGNIFYWDPEQGSDANSGTTPATAVQTFAAAEALATAGNHDVINCLATHESGITTVTTPITITKRTLKLRGPGHIFRLIPSSAGSDTLTIGVDDIEINGLYISTAGTGSDNAVSVTGDRISIRDCWISTVRGHGINLSGSNQSRIATCAIESCGKSGTGNGINLGNSATQAKIERCVVYDNVNGVALAGSSLANNIIENNLVYKNSGIGVTIGDNVANTIVRGENTIVNNSGGNTSNTGIDTYIETPSEGVSAGEIADAVWAEVITDITTPGSAGKTLKDAKTKATLASLK